jgi:hypothetical protein
MKKKKVNSSTERSRKSREKMKKNPEQYQEIKNKDKLRKQKQKRGKKIELYFKMIRSDLHRQEKRKKTGNEKV